MNDKKNDQNGQGSPGGTIDNLKILGKRIKELRKELGLKQIELAKALNIGHSYLSEIEKGKKNPKPGFFFKLFEVYSVSLNYLFFGIGDMKINGHSKEREAVTNVVTTDDLMWLVENSTLYRDNIMAFAAGFFLENEKLIKKSIEKQKQQKEDSNND